MTCLKRAKKEIVSVVESIQGCKVTELICHNRILPLIVSKHDVIKMIEELCIERELVEIEYILPNMTYRIKSFLLPKGTTVL